MKRTCSEARAREAAQGPPPTRVLPATPTARARTGSNTDIRSVRRSEPTAVRMLPAEREKALGGRTIEEVLARGL